MNSCINYKKIEELICHIYDGAHLTIIKLLMN